MSVVLANVSQLKPEIRLAQAISEFETSLSRTQKAIFNTSRSQALSSPPTPDDVMRFTAEIDRIACSGGSHRVRCFGPRLTNFLHVVQQFAALGDVIIGGSQNIIACGVWSLVRMSLLSVVKFSTHFEKLSAILMDVGRSAPRYQTMALLYPHSKVLQSHLFEYNIILVRLCHRILNFTQKSAFSQMISSFNDAELQTFQTDLNTWATCIKEEMDLSTAKKIVEESQGSSRLRALASKLSKDTSHNYRLATNIRVLDFVSTYNHQQTWKQTRKIGNSTLFQNVADYQKWKDQRNSCTLIYEGTLGSGKSILLANIVDDLFLHIQDAPNNAVAYFFCRHDIHESLKASTVIGSLVRQILRHFPDLTKVANLCAEKADFDQLLILLRRVLPQEFRTFFVLDGLDECEDAESEELTLQLRKLQKEFKILICVALRVGGHKAPESELDRFLDRKIISVPQNNPDIDAFIETELESCIQRGKLVLGEPSIILAIHDALSNGSKGMFLWVALQIEVLCTMKTDHAILEALEDLPRDLMEIFSRILQQSEAKGRVYRERTFQLILAAYRPLSVDELREALSVSPGDVVWDRTKLLNDIYATLSACGCLVTIDEEESTVRLVHQSVKQYLLLGLDTPDQIQSPYNNANYYMSQIILTYLNYGVFDRQVTSSRMPQLASSSLAPSKVIQSTLDSKRVQSIALKFLNSRRKHDYDVTRTLAEAREKSRFRPMKQFYFHQYAIQYYFQHIMATSRLEPTERGLLVRLFDGDILHISEEESMRVYRWASHCEYTDIVKVLLERNVFKPEKWHSEPSPLVRASAAGHVETVQALLEMGKFDVNQVEDKHNYLGTALDVAIDSGHEEVVRVLLRDNKISLSLEGDDGANYLSAAISDERETMVELLLSYGAKIDPYLFFSAIESENAAIVKLLLEYGAYPNFKHLGEITPLIYATQLGLETIVRLLMDYKGDPLLSDNVKRTSLFYAIEHGDLELIKLLLPFGTESRDITDQTPLAYAAKQGHLAAVQLLLNFEPVKVDVNSRDVFGQTPLFHAIKARKNSEPIIGLLLENGADLQVWDKGQRSLWDHAVQYGFQEVVDLLFAHGAPTSYEASKDHLRG